MDNEELDGVKFSEFPSQTPGNSDEVVGLHSGDNARFSIANIVAAVRNGLANIFVPLTRTINNKALSSDISLDSFDIDYDNTQSGLTADNVQEAIDELAQGGGGGGSAANVTYDPTTSGASATNVQDALDEAFGDLDDKQDTITANGILKGDGQGGVIAATPGTDYQIPLTAGTDYATPAQLADKANPGQIGYPETGTTASRNYSAGEYICWNGLTCTANRAISSGTTLNAGTGGNLNECAGGGLNYLSGGMHLKLYEGIRVTFSNQSYVPVDVSQIDSNLVYAKALIPFCTSQGTMLLSAINTAKTLVQFYCPAGTVTGNLSINLIAIY